MPSPLLLPPRRRPPTIFLRRSLPKPPLLPLPPAECGPAAFCFSGSCSAAPATRSHRPPAAPGWKAPGSLHVRQTAALPAQSPQRGSRHRSQRPLTREMPAVSGGVSAAQPKVSSATPQLIWQPTPTPHPAAATRRPTHRGAASWRRPGTPWRCTAGSRRRLRGARREAHESWGGQSGGGRALLPQQRIHCPAHRASTWRRQLPARLPSGSGARCTRRTRLARSSACCGVGSSGGC